MMDNLIAELSKMQIALFFQKNAPVTQDQCDQEAARIIGGSVVASTVQGATSYTVVTTSGVGSLVVQFRNAKSVFDLDMLRCVERAYDGYAPRHHFEGKLGNLFVYTMDDVGGTAMYLARDQLHKNDYALLRETLTDYARFFASAWHNTAHAEMPVTEKAMLFNQYNSQLQQLQTGLPRRFHSILEGLIIRLPSLFEDDWPLVPNHTDLLENNIHVNAETGHLIGICYWKDTVIGPFGVSLGGLETMLGINRMEQGWCYHPNQQELRGMFWKALLDALGGVTDDLIQRLCAARTIGLFLAHGFFYDDKGNKVPAGEGDGELPYLEAITLGLVAHDQYTYAERFSYCGWPLASLTGAVRAEKDERVTQAEALCLVLAQHANRRRVPVSSYYVGSTPLFYISMGI